ncbi:MAG: peptide deformylase [Candidatus Nealsonbacteria bacterium CG10_big_fil_rev_8_21_14_0_10_36_24]|uniref:Peptide deformylase n=1 Tax=Candidatus Nealsonbacteria bacterium CG10_big_fil_rev_8_21_14_0_10_36_24 TaxID=1974710 RepID=A0A2M6NSB4_9BACT|nr:MAG: peptide deformylase [Candidatus Nealsonbacteria bacterium CG10_big_fil_rev_8_21_14_0_10_36_24]
MAILEIKKFNEPVLRKKCTKIEKIDKKIKKLIVALAQTMEKNQGVGLAASQIGELKRVIVVQANLKDWRILGLINPKIVKKSKEKEIAEEGCLSFPGIFLKIKRAKKVTVEGLDIQGKKVRLEAKGLLSRVLQHEIDHLDGILFFNRLSLIRRIIFKLKFKC